MNHQIDPTRRRLLAAGAAAGGLLLSGCGLDRGAGPDRPEADTHGWGDSTFIDPPFTKPTGTLTDQKGKPFDLRADTKGKLSILFFGYTHCPDVCPVYLQTLAAALDAIGTGPGSRPQVLFVGVDVARDTPAVLDSYLAKIDPTFIGLTGDEHTIAQAISHLKMAPVVIGPADSSGNYEVGHPAQVTVFTHDDLCHRIYPSNVRQEEWTSDLPRLDQGEWQ